ncbi:DUF5998 family protein [Brevibacterium samyangense]|uniref:DUF5998 family protein n=1 Tax=Brevibacterium samyangense TaxID=366888 RepID=A0ABN2TFM2_9MICO
MSSIPHALVSDLQAAGYYPQLTGSMLVEALYGEEVLAHLVHMDTHVDYDSIHRHVTAFAVTDTRLLLVHVDDEHEAAAPGRMPRGATSVEDVPLENLRTVLIGRTYEDPARYRVGDRPAEVQVTVGWGSTRHLDVYPEACTDPNCQEDHGYGGRILSDDVVLRVSKEAEGQPAVDRAEHFALTLRRAVFDARRNAGARG